jgi:hypothetical protein
MFRINEHMAACLTGKTPCKKLFVNKGKIYSRAHYDITLQVIIIPSRNNN